MGRMSLLSAGLFFVPIAITIGVLVGYETYQTSHGQAGLGPRPNNAITTKTYCQKAYGIQNPPDSLFILNPNQWGTDTIGPGSQLCMNVTSFDNGTYATNDTAPAFTATWEYPVGPETEPVHAYANAKIAALDSIPVQLSTMSGLSIDMKWNYGVGAAQPNSTDGSALDAVLMNANVCIDSFLDHDSNHAGITETSDYEVMIWFGRYGPATQPIGLANGPLTTQTVGTGTFDLYYGPNSQGQKVFTWVAQQNTTEYAGNVEPLYSVLGTFGGPVTTDYLGYLAFGSETLSSGAEVTFSVPKLALNISTTTHLRM